MLSATSIDSDLRKHMRQCREARGSLHHLRCTVDTIDAFLTPRFATALGAMTALVLAGLAWVS